MRKDLREIYKRSDMVGKNNPMKKSENRKKNSLAMMGENNPRWNNGASEYPNHILLKKRRIEVLKKNKGKCEICGEPAKIIHHIDDSKVNHSTDNLIPLCKQCHWALHGQEYGERNKTSKYIRKYGMTLEQISHKLNLSTCTVLNWLKDPNKKDYIENEIQGVRETITNYI